MSVKDNPNVWPEQQKDGLVSKCVGEGLGEEQVFGEKIKIYFGTY